MADPFLGEIRVVGFSFAPVGWADCDGQLLSIANNSALFALLGTTYGGDGVNTFALPDFRGRIGVGSQGQGNGLSPWVPGELRGTEAVTLTTQEIPFHSHSLNASSATANGRDPAQGVFARPELSGVPQNLYNLQPDDLASPSMIGLTGGSLPHENRQPILALRYIIALEGIFPSPN